MESLSLSACWSCLLPRLLELTASSRGFNISSNSCCCAIMKSNSWSSLKSRINKRQKNLQWIIFYKSTDVKQVHHWGGHHCKEAFFFIGGWGGAGTTLLCIIKTMIMCLYFWPYLVAATVAYKKNQLLTKVTTTISL